MNMKLKKFKANLERSLESYKRDIDALQEQQIRSIAEIRMDVFSNLHPYEGELKNTVFITYQEHYKANSGCNVWAENLTHPCLAPYDRGYLKGVATDLNGYLTLRDMFRPVPIPYTGMYTPKFRASKHRDAYLYRLQEIESNFAEECFAIDKARIDALNAICKEITGMSIGYYVGQLNGGLRRWSS